MQPLRTWLFAPGNSERRVAKALGLEVDAIILDLEDACAASEKEASRAAIEEVEHARRLIEAFAEAARSGRTAIPRDGAMIDYPIADRARRVMAAAGRPL